MVYEFKGTVDPSGGKRVGYFLTELLVKPRSIVGDFIASGSDCRRDGKDFNNRVTKLTNNLLYLLPADM